MVNFSGCLMLLLPLSMTFVCLFDVVVAIAIERGDQGHSCKEHDICSFVLSTDVVVCLQKVQW